MKNKRCLILLMVAGTMLLSLTACSWLTALTNNEGDASSAEGQSFPPDAQGDSPSLGDAPSDTGLGEPEPDHALQNNGQGQEAQNAGQAEGGCENRFALDGSSNVTQGQEFEQGENFTVQWPVKNVGTCIWDAGYSLTYVHGVLAADATFYPIGQDVQPGETLTLSLDLVAPTQTGLAVSLWKLQDADGQLFGMASPSDAPLRVAIVVTQASNANNNGNGNSNITHG